MENRFRVDPKQPKVATTTMRREMTATQMRYERTAKRQDRFNAHRPIIQESEPVKDSRAHRLEMWKAERDKKTEFQQKKPFIVGIVRHHAGSPYVKRLAFTKKAEPQPKTQHSKKHADVKVNSSVKAPPVTGRVTRAMSKVQKQLQSDINKKPKAINEFAPSNFEFKAPKGVSALPLESTANFKALPRVFPVSVSQTAREGDVFGEKRTTPNSKTRQKAVKRSAKKLAPTPESSREFSAIDKDVIPADELVSDVTPLQNKTNLSLCREELDKVVENLENQCDKWLSTAKNGNIPTEIFDSINVAIGQTKLLIREKIAQYRGLINECEAQTGPVPVTESDLKGFWDMVKLQVDDVISKFNELAVLGENNWIERKFQQKSPEKRRKKAAPKPKLKPVKSSVRDHIAALRRAKASAQENHLEVPNALVSQEDKSSAKRQSTSSFMKENIRYQSPVVTLVRMQLSENWEKTKRRSSVLMRVTGQMKEISTPEPSSKIEPSGVRRKPLSSRKSGNAKENTEVNKIQEECAIPENSKQDMFSSRVVLEDCSFMLQKTPSVSKNKLSGTNDYNEVESPASNKTSVLNEAVPHLTPPLKTYSKSPRKEYEASDLEKQFDQLKGTPVFKHNTPKRTPRHRSSHRL